MTHTECPKCGSYRIVERKYWKQKDRHWMCNNCGYMGDYEEFVVSD